MAMVFVHVSLHLDRPRQSLPGDSICSHTAGVPGHFAVMPRTPPRSTANMAAPATDAGSLTLRSTQRANNHSASQMRSSETTTTSPPPRTRARRGPRTRASLACNTCRAKKIQCVPVDGHCPTCKWYGTDCIFSRPTHHARNNPRQSRAAHRSLLPAGTYHMTDTGEWSGPQNSVAPSSDVDCAPGTAPRSSPAEVGGAYETRIQAQQSSPATSMQDRNFVPPHSSFGQVSSAPAFPSGYHDLWHGAANQPELNGYPFLSSQAASLPVLNVTLHAGTFMPPGYQTHEASWAWTQ